MKSVLFLVFPQMELLDFAGPYEVLSVANQIADNKPFELKITSPNGLSVRCINGVGIEVDGSWTSTIPADCIILPGGEGSNQVVQNPELMGRLQNQVNQSERVVSICSGARILAHLNLLGGRKFATHYSVADEILNNCSSAVYEAHKRYVHSGPISTSAGVTAGMDLALDLVERYVGEKLRLEVEKYISYHRKKVM